MNPADIKCGRSYSGPGGTRTVWDICRDREMCLSPDDAKIVRYATSEGQHIDNLEEFAAWATKEIEV